jgi:lipoprotein-releasing system permease protein
VPLALASGVLIKGKSWNGLTCEIDCNINGLRLHGEAPIRNLYVEAFKLKSGSSPFWVYWDETAQKWILPSTPEFGDGVLLPRSFYIAGVRLGDRGYLAYMTQTTSSVQEQRLPVFVAGFYDPGIIPIGGKYVLANHDVAGIIRSSMNQDNIPLSNGINIRFDQLEQAEQVKSELQKKFAEAGIAPYWNIETYREFDFSRDIIQQLRSEKNLFTLLAAIIIIVACSNIVSMLIILVNDKKLEIGIMRSMGATSKSIALIFGSCGVIMGMAGSIIGILAAVITLQNLQAIIHLISRLQGHEMFNPLFFGEVMPTELSGKTLGFVIIATAIISLVAGLIPALKACLLRPSAILKSE